MIVLAPARSLAAASFLKNRNLSSLLQSAAGIDPYLCLTNKPELMGVEDEGNICLPNETFWIRVSSVG